MVTYYCLPQGEVVDRHVGIAVVFGAWPGRVLAHRGYRSERLVCRRAATAEEHEWLAACHRYQAYLYRSVEQLLMDEAEFVAPAVLDRIGRALRSAAAGAGLHSMGYSAVACRDDDRLSAR